MTRPFAVVVFDTTRDSTLPEDVSHTTTLRIFEPYSSSTTIGPTRSHISSRLPHVLLEAKSSTEAAISEGFLSATALPDITVTSLAQETDGGSNRDSRSGLRGGDESVAGPAAVTTDTTTFPFITVNKSVSFAVHTVQTSQEAGKPTPVPISDDLVGLSPADLEHAKSKASAHSDEPAKGHTNDEYIPGSSTPNPHRTQDSPKGIATADPP